MAWAAGAVAGQEKAIGCSQGTPRGARREGQGQDWEGRAKESRVARPSRCLCCF